jgi:multidrug efflux pump subunit AcrA (membrane-fusion protein)
LIIKRISKEKKMAKKQGMRQIVFVMGTMIIIGGLLFGPMLVAGDETKGARENNEAPVFSVRTEAAEKRSLKAFLEVNGDIVSRQEVEAFPDASGKLTAVLVTLGSRVRAGDIIAQVDPSKPGSTYMTSPVYAPISGMVSKTPLPEGMTVSPAVSVATISVIDNLEIITRIPEREIVGLETGLKAEVVLQAYPGEIFTATLTHVSPILDSASRTKLISLSFDKKDSRINAGMFARVRINTRTYGDVLTVPAEAVMSLHGIDMVYVSKNNLTGAVAEVRMVTPGVTLDGWTEIRAGLSEGEAVIVQGQQLLSGGEAIRALARGGK